MRSNRDHRLNACLVCLAVLGMANCARDAGLRQGRTAAGHTIPVTSSSSAAVVHFRNGQTLLDELRLGEAIGEFTSAIDLDPAFAQARAFRALATPGPEGLRELEGAYKESAGLPTAERTLIEALLADRQGDATSSLAVWKRLADLVPEDWRIRAGYGRHLVLGKQYALAVESFRTATQLNPDEPLPFHDLGHAHLRLGDAEGALEAFRRYAALSPEDPAAQDSLAEALMALGRFAEAEAAFRRASAIARKASSGSTPSN